MKRRPDRAGRGGWRNQPKGIAKMRMGGVSARRVYLGDQGPTFGPEIGPIHEIRRPLVWIPYLDARGERVELPWSDDAYEWLEEQGDDVLAGDTLVIASAPLATGHVITRKFRPRWDTESAEGIRALEHSGTRFESPRALYDWLDALPHDPFYSTGKRLYASVPVQKSRLEGPRTELRIWPTMPSIRAKDREPITDGKERMGVETDAVAGICRDLDKVVEALMKSKCVKDILNAADRRGYAVTRRVAPNERGEPQSKMHTFGLDDVNDVLLPAIMQSIAGPRSDDEDYPTIQARYAAHRAKTAVWSGRPVTDLLVLRIDHLLETQAERKDDYIEARQDTEEGFLETLADSVSLSVEEEAEFLRLEADYRVHGSIERLLRRAYDLKGEDLERYLVIATKVLSRGPDFEKKRKAFNQQVRRILAKVDRRDC
ncbi:MAG: hypothetical protein ACPGU7_01065 [Gammaproteobacteria bacterium]